jgi:hypothetical protein
MSRAAREPWRRIPPASGSGRVLRAAARVLAASRRNGIPPCYAYRSLLLALLGLAQALAELRAAQDRLLQAAAARDAATALSAVAASVPDSIVDPFAVPLPAELVPRRRGISPSRSRAGQARQVSRSR